MALRLFLIKLSVSPKIIIIWSWCMDKYNYKNKIRIPIIANIILKMLHTCSLLIVMVIFDKDSMFRPILMMRKHTIWKNGKNKYLKLCDAKRCGLFWSTRLCTKFVIKLFLLTYPRFQHVLEHSSPS